MYSINPGYDYNNSYDYSSGNAVGSMVAMFGITILLFYFLIFAYMITSYILQSLALYRMAKNRGLRYPGLAWVPVVNVWTMGSIVDHHSRLKGIDRKWRVLLLTLGIISAVAIMLYIIVSFMMGAAMVFGGRSMALMLILLIPVLLIYALSTAAQSLCTIVCTYKIFEELTPTKAIKYLLLTILVPLGGPICLLISSKSMIGVPVYDPFHPFAVPNANDSAPVEQ